MTIKENKYKVLIPTAGTGSRLGTLTKYINKSLISIENKPAISRIIDMFPSNTEFVISLGYKGELVKQFLTLAYPEKNFFFAQVDKYEGEGSGLGLSILACEKFLQEPFVFCSCDTIVTEEIPFPNKNIAGYSHRENKTEYRTLEIKEEQTINLIDKGILSDKTEPYIGLACIKDWQLFWQLMHEGGEEAIKIGESYALKSFSQQGILEAKSFTWFDTGNLEELNKTQQYFKEKDAPNILSKQNEAIWFINDKVIKFSDDKKFISDRVKRTKYLKNFVPEIINSTENMYEYRKEEGIVLSKIEDTSVFENLLNYSKQLWNNFDNSQYDETKFFEACKDFYYTKTLKRIDLYYKNYTMSDKETIVNGVSMPKLADILQKIDWQNLFNGKAGGFHGDFHFENIIYNPQNNKFTFLDWRQNFGQFQAFGDIYYDFAKLLHGLIICHELIAKDKYNIEIKDNIINYTFERKSILKDCENIFYNWLRENNYDIKKVKILTALIYLNIAALHHFPYCHLLYFLGKSMLYYELKEK